MPSIIIDGKTVSFNQGQTIFQAASAAGFVIPSLCSFEGIYPPTSCFVCVVKIKGKTGMIPSCATEAEEGMIVECGSEEVLEYRRKAIALLLSEHAGDCEAPCTRICPAGLDMPVVAGHIAAQDLARAASAVWRSLPLPGVLGRICPAPCEKGCRRALVDSAVAIRDLHKSVAEAVFRSDDFKLPHPTHSTGKKVAIVGAGPAGLACGYYLALHGHACEIFDHREQPGGMLRYGTDRRALPLDILEQEIGVIREMGVAFNMRRLIEDQQSLDNLMNEADAVILATGSRDIQGPLSFNVNASFKGITVEPGTFLSSQTGVFACGAAITPGQMTARAIGQGRLAAESVHRFFKNGGKGAAGARQFDSRLGNLYPGEIDQFTAPDLPAISENDNGKGPFTKPIVSAAARCLRCDCGKKDCCALRSYAHEYGVRQEPYRTGARKRVSRKQYASGLMHEPGKCISCGRCIGILAAENIKPGLSFIGRGFGVMVDAPFGAAFDSAMGTSMDRCIAACPTGALWNWKRRDEKP